MRVVVLGSLSYDFIMNFAGRFADRIMPEKIHVLSLSFFVHKLQKQLGGTALNQAYTLKLLGTDPKLVTTAGFDWKEIGVFLRKYKVTTGGIKVVLDEPCSSYHVVTDQDDNQIGAFHAGASKYNKTLKIRQPAPPAFTIIGPTDPVAIQKFVTQCQALGYRYLYDPAFQIGSFTPDELRVATQKAEILIGNDYEIALIEQRLGISHDALAGMVPVLITTLGSKGSVIESHKEAIHVKPARVANVTDPTGAGDAYRAGFIAGYLRLTGSNPVRRLTGDELLMCGQMGSVAAAYTVEKYGTVTHHFTKKEFTRRYKESYGKLITL
jgi:adenosine kinase